MMGTYLNFSSKKIQKFNGGAGYRSRYLSHAKRALYHLSYAPNCTKMWVFEIFIIKKVFYILLLYNFKQNYETIIATNPKFQSS